VISFRPKDFNNIYRFYKMSTIVFDPVDEVIDLIL